MSGFNEVRGLAAVKWWFGGKARFTRKTALSEQRVFLLQSEDHPGERRAASHSLISAWLCGCSHTHRRTKNHVVTTAEVGLSIMTVQTFHMNPVCSDVYCGHSTEYFLDTKHFSRSCKTWSRRLVFLSPPSMSSFLYVSEHYICGHCNILSTRRWLPAVCAAKQQDTQKTPTVEHLLKDLGIIFHSRVKILWWKRQWLDSLHRSTIHSYQRPGCIPHTTVRLPWCICFHLKDNNRQVLFENFHELTNSNQPNPTDSQVRNESFWEKLEAAHQGMTSSCKKTVQSSITTIMSNHHQHARLWVRQLMGGVSLFLPCWAQLPPSTADNVAIRRSRRSIC